MALRELIALLDERERLAGSLPHRVQREAVRVVQRFRERRRARAHRTSAAARVAAGGPTVELYQVPDFGGAFEIDIRSDLARRVAATGGFEPHLAALVRALVQPGDHCVDIGANIGFYSVLCGSLAGPGGRVLGVEPMQVVAERARANVSRHGLTNVEIEVCAASAQTGTMEIEHVEGREEFAALGAMHHAAIARRAEARRRTTVHVHLLDDLVQRHGLDPRFVKVDTEGGELGVLAGAPRLLAARKAAWLVETSDELLGPQGRSVAEVIGLLEGAGYRCRDAATGRPVTAGHCAGYNGDIVGLPSS